MDPAYGVFQGGGGNGDIAASAAASHAVVRMLTTRYLKHSRSVGILWGVFTVCSAILNIVVFLQDQWVGDTNTSKSPGHFGLWRFCTVLQANAAGGDQLLLLLQQGAGGLVDQGGGTLMCLGSLDNFASILSPAFRAATVFVGISVVTSLMCVVGLLLFCVAKSSTVFEICGTLQILSGLCMLIGILCFPAGWDNDHVRGICGANAEDYSLGDCGIRWAYVLAVVAILDAWILSCLAFTLSNQRAKPLEGYHGPSTSNLESPYMNPGSIYKGEINQGYLGDWPSVAGSRKSLNLHHQPVVMLPHPSSGNHHHMSFMHHEGPHAPPQMAPPPPPPPPPDVYAEFSHRRHRDVRDTGNNVAQSSASLQVSSPYRSNQANSSTNNLYGSSIQNFQL